MNIEAERAMIRKINASRARHGLRPLQRGWLLTFYARLHARRQVNKGIIFHGDPGAWLLSHGGSWNWWGENVGCVPQQSGWIERLHRAFMNSPPHRANILGKFTRVGVGFAKNDKDLIFATIVFKR